MLLFDAKREQQHRHTVPVDINTATEENERAQES